MPAYFDGEQLLGSVHLIWTRYRKFKCDIYVKNITQNQNYNILMWFLYSLLGHFDWYLQFLWFLQHYAFLKPWLICVFTVCNANIASLRKLMELPVILGSKPLEAFPIYIINSLLYPFNYGQEISFSHHCMQTYKLQNSIDH